MRYILQQLFIICLSYCLAQVVAAQTVDWEGDWVTDQGLMSLSQSGDKISGTYGDGGTISGKVTRGELSLSYRNGNSTGTLAVKMSDTGDSFNGEWKSDRSSGTWRGWKKSLDAESGELADFSGYWLTSWGPMQIEQQMDKISGTYASHGWSSFTGEVVGRRMKIEWKKLHFTGTAWLEMTADGTRLFGMNENDTNTSTWTGIRVPEHTHHVEPVAGEIVKGYADNGMLYHLRMPNDWKAGEDVDVIVLLHGSNWTTAGMVYITNENWPDIGKKFAILGIQGERWVKYSDAESPRFNYTYVNWVGRSTLGGFPYTDRESPYLVSNVLDELDELHDFGRIFVGGHSQGGYLTYLMHMHFPEKLAGTFPVAGGLIYQSEPDAFDDEPLMEAQRATPMAIIHGKRDNVVSYSTGERNFNRLSAHDFHMTKFITPNSGHPYDFLPIDEAMQYLDALSTDDAEQLAEYGEAMVAGRQWRDVGVVLARAKEIEGGKAFSPIWKAYEAAAKKDADRLRRSILSNQDNKWVDKYLKWHDQFALSQAGADTVMAYKALQEEHDEAADELMNEAQKAFNSNNARDGYAKYQEVVDKFYASKQYKSVKATLDNR